MLTEQTAIEETLARAAHLSGTRVAKRGSGALFLLAVVGAELVWAALLIWVGLLLIL
jgi:hypothetical protein